MAHAVKFYDDDAALYDLVTRFLTDGIAAGEAALIIATPQHREAIRSRLRDRGIADDDPKIDFLDAGRTLEQFLVDDMPDDARFAEVIGGLVEETSRRHGTPVRAYGEMVDVLWQSGKTTAAIRLEELWNELLGTSAMTLLCAYRVGPFVRDLSVVSQLHDDVLPAAPVDATDIVALQQRAAVLETEVLRRKELEIALREALTARRRAEQELKEYAEQHAFLLGATDVLTGSLDYETRVRELAKLFVPRVADWCVVEIPADDLYPEVCVAHQQPHEESERHEVTTLPIRSGDRVIGRITLGNRDPHRKRSPADLAVAAELTRRGGIALENARLYRIAQQANRTKDEFLATLSHELRTPLTAILGWAHMLNVGGLSDDVVRTALETIERSAQTQATIIDDLLDVSRAVTGKFTLRQEEVDVGTVVDGAIETLRLAAEARRVTMQVTAASEKLVVVGDATRLQQIVWNLLSNAVKFSEAGGVVTVAVERDRGHARVTVRDQGRGIPLDFLPHVFEPFRQASLSTTRDHGGLGLGLAIVKYFTELHGGTVTATSGGEGQGATFSVTLPLAVQMEDRQSCLSRQTGLSGLHTS